MRIALTHSTSISSTGDRELKHTLAAGQSWTTSTQEKTFWITTMDQETDEGLLLNYGWYYSPVKTRMKKERCYITDCKSISLFPPICDYFKEENLVA